MNSHNKHDPVIEPMLIHLGNDDEKHDVGATEIVPIQARDTGNSTFKRRSLHSQVKFSDDEDENRLTGFSEVQPPSKTKIKKQMHDLRDLGKELTELGKDQLMQLDIPDKLRDAILEMKHINKFGAQRRQTQFIGKLMREVETAPILAKLDAWKGTSQQHVAYLHQLERWRDRLLESDGALTELLAAHSQADAQRLRALIRNAQREKSTGKPPKNFRELFQVLREIIPEKT